MILWSSSRPTYCVSGSFSEADSTNKRNQGLDRSVYRGVCSVGVHSLCVLDPSSVARLPFRSAKQKCKLPVVVGGRVDPVLVQRGLNSLLCGLLNDTKLLLFAVLLALLHGNTVYGSATINVSG